MKALLGLLVAVCLIAMIATPAVACHPQAQFFGVNAFSQRGRNFQQQTFVGNPGFQGQTIVQQNTRRGLLGGIRSQSTTVIRF